MRHVEIDVPDLVIALIEDRYLVGLLKENHRLGLQHHGGAEGIARGCRPERIVSLDRFLRLLLHYRGSPGRK